MSDEKITFSFGENWLNYIRSLSIERYEDAKKALRTLLDIETLEGESFLDIGCGSGIVSLCAIELGSREVISIDSDPKSVEACKKIKSKCSVGHWKIYEGSILDKEFIKKLGKLDYVYSWGVLHHTGAMWEAIDNSARLVKDNGILAIALYNRTKTSDFWLKYKHLYNRSGVILKKIMVGGLVIPRMIVRTIKLKHPLKDKRGMSVYYDAIDWAGGLPYECASYDEVCKYLEKRGFNLVKGVKTDSIGCNEFIFKRAFHNLS